MVIWVDKDNGGGCNTEHAAIGQVDKIYSTDSTFAAVLKHGTPVVWG